WRVDVVNRRDRELPCDAVFIQDLGLGERGFLMGNEAYASQYLDHFPARHPVMDHVLMSRQNLSQGGAHRDADQFALPFGASLPSNRLQYETACAALQSEAATLAPGAAASWTFFGVYNSDHPDASSDADLEAVDAVERASTAWKPREISLSDPARSILHDAPAAVALVLEKQARRGRY